MINIKEINIGTIDLLANYLVLNTNAFSNFIQDFGDIINENGYGSYWLRPINEIFRSIWIFQKNNKVEGICFDLKSTNLTLEDIYSVYNNFTYHFVPYDDTYEYIFYNGDSPFYTILITSQNKLLVDKSIFTNIDILQIRISLVNN